MTSNITDNGASEGCVMLVRDSGDDDDGYDIATNSLADDSNRQVRVIVAHRARENIASQTKRWLGG